MFDFLTLRALSSDVSARNVLTLKLPQTARMSQMPSATVFMFILAFSVIFLNEDSRRHYQEIYSPGQQ